MDAWVELQFETAAEVAEILAAEVGEMTGGVELRDAGTLLRPEDAGRTVVVALCAPADVDTVLEEVDAACTRARAAGLAVDPLVIRRREAHEDEWRDVWKQFFRATRVGRSFIVRPSWDPGAIVGSDRVIDIDPGRAFGTGGHPSTRLVIELCEDITHPVTRFLDLGCGSGILSMAAALLWPTATGLAIDVDIEAAACTEENLARNRITTVTPMTGTVADAPAGVRYDVVLANIQATVLIPEAEAICARVAPGGTLILSGLLLSDVDEVSKRYAALGLRAHARRDEGEWAALVFEVPRA